VGFVGQDESCEARAEESIVAAGEEERLAQATLADFVTGIRLIKPGRRKRRMS
jgi:hypothetical protein